MKFQSLIFSIAIFARNLVLGDSLRGQHQQASELSLSQVINMESLLQALCQKLGWTEQQVKRGVNSYEQHLLLARKYPDAQIVPDKMTDRVLHLHLITGDRFTQDCLMLFNSRFEHEAGFGTRGRIDRLNWLNAFAKTQFLMIWHFGIQSIGPIGLIRPANCVLSVSA